MKSILILAFAFLSQIVSAQVSDADIDLIQNKFGTEKEKIVADYIKLEKENAKSFWSIYNEYEQKRKDIGEKRLNLVLHYNDNQTVLQGNDLDNEIKKFIDLKKDTDQLIETFYDRIKKEFGSKTASDFYIIEVYFQGVVRENYMTQIPFLKELDNKYKN